MSGRLTSVAAARRWASTQLLSMYSDPGDDGDDAILVVSDLVTNSIQARAHQVDVAIDGHRESIRVEVTDDAPGIPTLTFGALDNMRGRGLRIIDKLATNWGVRLARPGKTVWADLPMRPPAAAVFRCDCEADRAAALDGARL
jgi:hypothetical protein